MKTALTQLIEKLIDKYGSDNNFINEAITDAMLFKKAEKEQMINFHIEVMKEGLIEEGDKKWSDEYLPKISKTAEQYYTKTFKSDE